VGINVETRVLYGTFSCYVYESYSKEYDTGQTPYIYHYITPGLGMVKEVDYWTDNAPRIQELAEISSVPAPASMLVLGMGILCISGLAIFRRKESI
jgi:hypothetical protein